MEIHRILEKENPSSSTIDDSPMTVMSEEIVFDDHMMIYFLGANNSMDEIRELKHAQPLNDKVIMVKLHVQKCDISKVTLEHVQFAIFVDIDGHTPIPLVHIIFFYFVKFCTVILVLNFESHFVVLNNSF